MTCIICQNDRHDTISIIDVNQYKSMGNPTE